VFVPAEFAKDLLHGGMACTTCHGGDPSGTTRKAAHAGLHPDPSQTRPQETCGPCHPGIVADHARSLHATEAGKRHAVEVRAGGPLAGDLDAAYRAQCGTCHASCGQCHVSSPANAGGGLLESHRFVRSPPNMLTCTGCHGTRVMKEYRGQNAGIPADVHSGQGMQCTDCHDGAEMHGTGASDLTHRYQVPTAPSCEECHPDDASFRQQPFHQPHRDGDGALTVSCQVCHAAPYKHCNDCHVSVSGDGLPQSEVNPPDHVSMLAVKIGYNPRRDALHPQRFVTLRHVPAAPATFSYYGENLLPAFGAAPTWVLSTPHTIRLRTDQAWDCTTSCHGRRDLFLGPADLPPGEEDANASVVVAVPPGS